MSKRVFKKVGLVCSILFLVTAFWGGSALAQAKYGMQVAKNLYHVHTRVLWDLGWYYREDNHKNPIVIGTDQNPAQLSYGDGNNLFLSPLEGYGIPEKPNNAYRKVRLYVYYGHLYNCQGTPTVKIVNSGDQKVEFSLPGIHGAWDDVGANWSDFKDLSEYQGIGHAQIYVYMKGSTGICAGTPGAMYRIEAHFYDGYGKNWAP